MLSGYLFDQRQGKEIKAWKDALDDLGESQMLWLDLQGASEKEESEVREALDLGDRDSLAEQGDSASLEQHEGYLSS